MNGHIWQVIYDPTRKGDNPGIFYGGRFRWIDIELPKQYQRSVPCPWPDGIIFENVHTGERVTIINAQAIREKDHHEQQSLLESLHN